MRGSGNGNGISTLGLVSLALSLVSGLALARGASMVLGQLPALLAGSPPPDLEEARASRERVNLAWRD
jgi:hypothetical protein